MGVTVLKATRNPKDTQELQRARLAVSKFARSLHILLRAARLYQKNHPHQMESLEAAAADLREALESTTPLEIRVERGRLAFRGQALSDSRGELKTLADHLHRRGVNVLVFLAQAHLGELGALAHILGRTPLNGESAADWAAQLAEQHIEGIRINEPLEEKKADTVLTSLMAAVLAPEVSTTLRGVPAADGSDPSAASDAHVKLVAASFDELNGVLQVIARITAPLRREKKMDSGGVVATLREAVAGADNRAVTLLAGAMTTHAPLEGEGLEPYFCRLAELLAREHAARAYSTGRCPVPRLRNLFVDLAAALAAAGIPRPVRTDGAKWTDESHADYLLELFWAELSAEEKSAILRSEDAWCVPVNAVRSYLEQLAAAGGGRQARFTLLNFARCLESDRRDARLAAATGLTEMSALVASLWPAGSGPAELTRIATRALLSESTPEVAGVLAAVLDGLALLMQERGEYAELENLLATLDRGSNGPRHSLIPTLIQSVLDNGRWQRLLDAALEHKPLDASLPRILGRDPERLLDDLSTKLNAPDGLLALAPITRLLRAIGEPVAGTLVTRLFDPRTQRAGAAVKLLSATHPERLVKALPRALPSWDWNLQDMAVGELVRQGAPGASAAFVEAMPHAHPLVVPMMIDEVGLAGESAAVDLLIEIAAGAHERLNDVFVRIKAIEALGRMKALEAADVLRAVVRQRFGLAYAEPAGLRSAAEEALGLIENRPSSTRVRIVQQAAEKASVSFTRPRRYLRVPLDSPLAARISVPETAVRVTARSLTPGQARVTTISLGGAFVESKQRLSVGDSFALEIRSGLRKIQSTAVVRNIAPDGGGVEFVHMKQDDREKLRRLVSRLLKK